MRDLTGPRWMNRAEKKNKGRRQPHTVSDKDKAHRQERWSSCWRNKFGRKRIWKASNFRQKFQRPWEFTEGSGRREHQSDEESSIDDLIRWSIRPAVGIRGRTEWEKEKLRDPVFVSLLPGEGQRRRGQGWQQGFWDYWPWSRKNGGAVDRNRGEGDLLGVGGEDNINLYILSLGK